MQPTHISCAYASILQAMAQAYQQVQATPIPAAAGAGIAPVTQHLTTAMQQAPVASTAMQQVAAVAHAPGLGPEPAMQAAVPVQAPMQAAAPAPAPQPAATSPTKKGLLGFFKKGAGTGRHIHLF